MKGRSSAVVPQQIVFRDYPVTVLSSDRRATTGAGHLSAVARGSWTGA
jgi:hypothetical protein